MILKGYLCSVFYVLICLAIALVLHKFGVGRKITRKVVHILVGFEWVILYTFFGAGSIHFLAVCIGFTLLLFAEYKLKLIPAISSGEDNAPGTVYYGLAMTIMAAATMLVGDFVYPFGIAVFCTSLGDGLAGLVGQGIKRYNIKIWNNKSIFGTLANAVACFAVVSVFSRVFDLGISVWWAILIALFSAVIELVSEKGLDNLWITLSVGILSYSVINISALQDYVIPIIITPVLMSVVVSRGVLTRWGAFAALLLDVSVSLAFGNQGFLVLFGFLSISVIADKIKKTHKNKERNNNIGETRGVTQVFANGFASMLCAMAYAATSDKVFLIAFTASMAEALADTVGSGIGVLSTKTYDVFKFKKCDAGISGGMSLLGTASSLAASIFIALIPLAFGKVTPTDAMIIAAFGFSGAVLDSLLGSLLQIKYKCSFCGRITDSDYHCSRKCQRHSGVSFITNSTVNFLSTFLTALAVILILKLV